ncbi:signal transduction histidine kinase [Thermocatellispora tengchongensis]|uniref:Signal transduction histidine kinase n=1 Tax=Thermocatellispora tengchongensis TaxID=1073253 RepID=A0A840P2L6_9ACTN|nr:ATP-binding protein [Thermocatellispora tengchongensis]MBB5132131.1 signal transduction histidine kinase [Thermocatellispora tengchongensis]
MPPGLLSLDPESRDPARAALNRIVALCAAVMRGAEGVVAAVAALLGAVPPVSYAWLGPAVAVNLSWTALFVWTALRHGLPSRLMAGELVVTGAFCLAQGRLVVAEATVGGASWIAVLVTMTILLASITWRARAAVPAGLALAGAHLAGAELAGFAGGAFTFGIHLLQIAATVTLMTLLRRSAGLADAALARLRAAQKESAVLRARRADERMQYSRVHDTVLNTLTTIGAGGAAATSRTLREQAASDLGELERIAAGTAATGGAVDLGEVLSGVAGRSALSVAAELRPQTVPRHVAEAFAGAAAEALTNVARHAGVGEARLRCDGAAGRVLVEVIDAGGGFDRARVPEGRFGLRRSIVERMESVGGGAGVESGAGGTRVTLWWSP